MKIFNNLLKKSAIQKALPIVDSKYIELDRRVKEGAFEDRMAVIDTLNGDRDERAIQVLTWILYNGNHHSEDITMFDERAIAAGVLGKIGGELALSALEDAIDLPGLESSVNQALIEIRKRQDAEALINGLKTTPIPVLEVLTEKKNESGVEYARILLDSSDITTTVTAARYLGVVQCQLAVDKLTELLQHSEYIDVQHSAAVALGRIGGPKAKTVLLEALNHKSEWAVSGAVKGLAFIWANGDSSILELIGECKYNNICSKDSIEEQNAQFEAKNNMFLSKYTSPATGISGAEIVDAAKSKVTFKEKCEACGYISVEQRTSIIPYKGKLHAYFHCPQCNKGQIVLIEGPK